jgi:hypothetical protein
VILIISREVELKNGYPSAERAQPKLRESLALTVFELQNYSDIAMAASIGSVLAALRT